MHKIKMVGIVTVLMAGSFFIGARTASSLWRKGLDRELADRHSKRIRRFYTGY